MPLDCISSSQWRRRPSAWMAIAALLALADLLHLPSSPTSAARMTCEAYSSTRSFPLWRPLTSQPQRIDKLRVIDYSSTSPTSFSPSYSLSNVSTGRSKNTALLSINDNTSGSLTASSPSQPAATSETPPIAINYHWTKQNLAIALPALMGLLADPLLSMVDTGFVGRLSSTDLAALGVCTSIFHMAFSVFRGSTVATTSLVGNAKSKQEARQVTKISLVMAGIIGTLVLLVLRLGGSQVLATMGVAQSSPLYTPACSYLYARAWAAPAVVGIVVAEGAFRGSGDSKTPLVAASFAGFINLILDPILMFPLKMGMMGAAVATALAQFAATGVYGWRMLRRGMLPQINDTVSTSTVSVPQVVKAILGANLAMLAKQGSLLVFYTYATALATRLGPAHVATHQVALSFFWLVTFVTDSGSVSGQVLMSQSMSDPIKAWSLTKYMIQYALAQGLAVSALVASLARVIATVFTQDPTIRALLVQIMPYMALQQTLISLCLVLEGLAIGGNQFRFMASGTIVATCFAMRQLSRATSAVGIWSHAVTVFFSIRLFNAIIGVMRVHWNLKKKSNKNANQPSPVQKESTDNGCTISTTSLTEKLNSFT